MDRVARSLRFPLDQQETLEQITWAAATTVPGIDYVSLSVTGRDGTIKTLAPTDAVAVRADELQYKLGEGPCLAAVLAEPMVQVDDLGTDLRWPLYGPQATELGLRSQLAFQFRAAPNVRGGVNLYSDRPHSVGPDARQLGMLFASLAAAALGWSRRDEAMNEALQTRSGIGQAIGIVMERYTLDSDRAFSFLVRTSQTGNVKLRDVAAGIVADATTKAAGLVTKSLEPAIPGRLDRQPTL